MKLTEGQLEKLWETKPEQSGSGFLSAGSLGKYSTEACAKSSCFGANASFSLLSMDAGYRLGYEELNLTPSGNLSTYGASGTAGWNGKAVGLFGEIYYKKLELGLSATVGDKSCEIKGIGMLGLAGGLQYKTGFAKAALGPLGIEGGCSLDRTKEGAARQESLMDRMEQAYGQFQREFFNWVRANGGAVPPMY